MSRILGFSTFREQDIVKKKLIEILPHDSGIDCNWEFKFFKNGNFFASNYYHRMNEHGYYDGIIPFKVYFKATNDYQWKINIKSSDSRIDHFMVRNYLEELIIPMLSDGGLHISE